MILAAQQTPVKQRAEERTCVAQCTAGAVWYRAGRTQALKLSLCYIGVCSLLHDEQSRYLP